MTAAVRYHSQSGRTKTIAEAIARGAGVTARSVTEEPTLTEKIDVLFLGGAPYANIMAHALRAYAEGLDPALVGRVVLFTTSNWSRRTVRALRKMLRDKGIAVEEDYFYAHMTQIASKTAPAEEFAKQFIND